MIKYTREREQSLSLSRNERVTSNTERVCVVTSKSDDRFDPSQCCSLVIGAPFSGFVAASSPLVVAGIDPGTVADGVVVVQLLGDRDGEVGEVDVLVLGTRPSCVATCYPQSSSLSDSRTGAMPKCAWPFATYLRRMSASSAPVSSPHPNRE